MPNTLPDPLAVAEVEATLNAAINACVGLPADAWPGFISQYVMAVHNGAEPPAAAAHPTPSCEAEMPALATLLERAVKAAYAAKDTAPLKAIADFLWP